MQGIELSSYSRNFVSDHATYDPKAVTTYSKLVKQRRHKLVVPNHVEQMENHDEKHDVPRESLPLPNQREIEVN